ncbi:MAG TPA: triple tyrosine motif-containing protein [Candidatus Polarisedimenticolia bacterium]|nr:triple tyrosine motif-containing protein [Candidatus Polarisedimenticolia bacterium]
MNATRRIFLSVLAGALLPHSVFPQEAARAPGAKAPPGTYKVSCVVLDVQKSDLKALCRSESGDWRMSELHETDKCLGGITNLDGVLLCISEPGSYLHSCSDVRARGNTLVARCRSSRGWNDTTLEDFRDCTANIRNADGHLVCDEDVTPSPFEGGDGLEEALTWRIPAPPRNSHLEHQSWTFKDGAPERITALARTADGFLWLSSEGGLSRFDGRQFEIFQPSSGEEFLRATIYSLFAPPSGGLWIGYAFGGIGFLDRGRLTNYGGDFAARSGTVRSMLQDADGTMWALTTRGLWRLDHSEWRKIGAEWNFPIESVTDVVLDPDGGLWASGEGLILCLPRGGRRFQVARRHARFNRRDSQLTVLADLDGSLWAQTPAGLDHFFFSQLVKQDLPADGWDFALAAGDDGEVWAGAGQSKTPLLCRISGGRATPLEKHPAFWLDFVYRAPDRTLWLGVHGSGLWHETLSGRRPVDDSSPRFEVRKDLWNLSRRDWEFVALPPEATDQSPHLQAITQDPPGGMWLSLGRYGLYRLADGVWTACGGRRELPTSGVVCEFTDSLGRVWFGSMDNRLAVLDGDRVRTFGPGDGIRVGAIQAVHGRGPRIWIGGEFGLQRFDAGRFVTIPSVNAERLRGITGIVETADGDLWLNGLSGIIHIPRSEIAEADRDPRHPVRGDHWGRRQGLTGLPGQLRPLPSAIEAADGRLWFSLGPDVVWIDPSQLRERTRAPAPAASILTIASDGVSRDPSRPLVLPARTSSVEIGYAAANPSDPDAIRFRYKVDELDPDWNVVDAPNPVTYRNLAPGHYHFRVAASDPAGAWSAQASSLEFTILPAYYQATWFRMLSALGAAGAIGALVLLRVRQATRRVRAQMEVRLGERERIARELHDTLLQSVQGLILKFQSVANTLPRDEPARGAIETTLDHADRVVAEGRQRVLDLRSGDPLDDLPAALQRVAEEGHGGSGAPVRITTEGEARPLDAMVLEEAYAVGREALVNAQRHSAARNIDVDIIYGSSQFVLRVRDDGRGIDPSILGKGGRANHFGLQGMRERARRIGARFDLKGRAGGGTEMELTVPAATAYRSIGARTPRSWLRRGWKREPASPRASEPVVRSDTRTTG